MARWCAEPDCDDLSPHVHVAVKLDTASSYQAVEMVAAAVEDRRLLEAEVERLRAALEAERDRADCMVQAIGDVAATAHAPHDPIHQLTWANLRRVLAEHEAARKADR